ncbi:hypothetical protein ACHAW6_005839, partial [Cyclotella cf. meneghiniana]
EVIRFHHASLGYPTKATLLTAARHSNLVTFPGLTPENISPVELTHGYKAIHNRWKTTGVIAPNWHILDNEAPEEFKQASVELTPADMHRRNIAKRAIQTYQGHFISIIAGVSNDFPIHQWDKLVPQAVLTLYLLRQSNVAPNVSAYSYHHGNFDYNQMPHH